MATLQEILEEQSRIRTELQRMENDETVTEESDGDLRDTLISRWEELDSKAKPLIDQMQRISAITRAAADDSNLEAGADTTGSSGNGPRPAGTGIVSRFGGTGPDLVVSRHRDPYDNNEAVRSNVIRRSELRERAFDAVEHEVRRGNLIDDFAEVVTRRIQDGGTLPTNNIARHVLLTGGEEYQDAFRAYLADPQGEAQRAALSLTLANGGYLLPFVLDPTIILTNASSANPWRRISNVKTTTSNTWNGVNSAGVNAAWLTEGTIVTDGTPTVGNIVVTPQKAAAWVFGSYEVLEDTDFGQQLPALLADAKDRLEEAAFATGAGSGGVPQGVVNGATTVITTATTLVVAVGDIYAVQGALPPRFRNAPKCSWAANVAIINKIRQLDTAGGSSFWTNLGKGQPETLLGAPIYESTTMSSAVSSGSLEAIFGDFGQFLIVDRVGVSMIYEPLVKGTGGILPAGQAGWFMFWRTGSALSTVNAFRVMKGA
jgi:HK97 family phage major capsid protein